MPEEANGELACPFRVDDTDNKTPAKVVDLGGAIVLPGRRHAVQEPGAASDPTGARFKLVARM